MRKNLTEPQVLGSKELLRGTASMLVGLIKSEAGEPLREVELEYRTANMD